MIDLKPAHHPDLRSHLDSADWYRALTLAERRKILGGSPVPTVDPAEVEDLLRRWRSLSFFADGDLFHRRLDAEGWTEEELLEVLGAPDETLRDRLGRAPEWLDQLEAAFLSTDDLPLADLAPSRGEQSSPFLAVVRPLLTSGYRRLEACLAELPADTPWDPDQVTRTLFSHLAGRLSMILRRVMVLELQIAHLEESLVGDTPEERFQSFIRRLEDRDEALEILGRYPVLARLVTECVDRWVEFAAELLRRYAEDWPRLVATFDLGDTPEAGPNLLREARPGAGDSHRGGRSVILLTFSSGAKLVYKPRSLGGERAFNDLLGWINERGFEPAFRVLEALDRGAYGWEEFVEPAPCADEEEIHRFYQRQGGYLTLLYLLEANDIHFENLIAAGEHPMIIDLETLFHPAMDELESEHPILPTGNRLYRSVQNTGLLPHRMWGTQDQEEGIDLSGLGSAGGQTTAQRFLGLEGVGTDEMRFVRKHAEIPEMDHTPRLHDTQARAQDYTDELVTGFSDLYRLLDAHREELASASGPLAAFADTECRVIFRPTIFYNELLGESFHPDVTQDALERDLFLEGLWAEVRPRPRLAALIPAELLDLHHVDIPLFAASPGSRDLWTGTGERIPDYWRESAMSRVKGKLEEWGDADLERQAWLVRTTLDALPRPGARVKRETYPFREAEAPAGPEELLDAARAAADRLERLAFRGPGGDVSWPIVSPVGKGHWAYNPAEPGLYQGLAGIALFLAYLGDALGESRFTELARGAWVTLRHQLRSERVLLPGVGAFTGWGGILYSAAHLGLLWNDEEVLGEAEAVLADLPSRLAEDDMHDVVGGAAGFLLSLRSLHRVRPSERTVEAAALCAESLASHARDMDTGCGWVVPAAGATPLAGLSHGAAGIALALLESAALTGQQRFHELACRAIEYERTLFSPAEGNWVDLREGDRPEGALRSSGHDFVVGWCHGAPGIGLARLAGLRYLDGPEIRQEIDIALRTTLADGFGSTHCLCHGDLGNLELLLTAALELDRPDLRERAYRLAGGALHGIGDHGWLYGYPARVEPLGLMVGLAGIGYQLLRLARPDEVPSVLTLDPPVVGGGGSANSSSQTIRIE